MTGRSWRVAVLVALAGLALPAAATPRFALSPFGQAGAAVQRQVREALCASLECVPWGEVATGGAKDLAKARKAGVAGLLVGGVIEREGKPWLALNLYAKAPEPVRSFLLPLGPRGLLATPDLARLQAQVGAALGAGAGPAPAPAAPSTVAASPVLRPPPAAAPERSPQAQAPRAAPLLVGEVGIVWTRRSLRYVGAASPGLLEFEVGLFTSIRGRLEVHPLAGGRSPAAAGLGLFVDYASAIGLETAAGGTVAALSMTGGLALGATFGLMTYGVYNGMIKSDNVSPNCSQRFWTAWRPECLPRTSVACGTPTSSGRMIS